jgi:hypothetical protein
MTSAGLKARLDRERTKGADGARAEFLSAIGVSSLEEARDAVRLSKALPEALARAGRATELEAVIAGHLAIEEAALTESQRAAVTAIAGGDPVARLRTIGAARPTWAAS